MRAHAPTRPVRNALIAVLVAAAALAVLTASAAAAPRLFVNGDSLAVGAAPHLPAALPGWRISSSASVSRHAYEGPAILKAQGKRLPKQLLISLGTNDDPSQTSIFRKAIRDTMDVAGRSRCVVWFNVVRPPYQGISYAGYNRALKREAAARENLRVINWVRMVRRHPKWVGGDGVHVSAAGYRARARAGARAVRACR